MLGIVGAQHHGKELVREIAKDTFLRRVKEVAPRVVHRAVLGVSAAVLFVGGWCAALVIVQITCHSI